jgi:undecaprenyl-diphosphatase
MNLVNIVILAIVQGLAELLPVSSSAHVVVAEKLLGLDPSSPPMTLLLVMLHTGTMFAVIVYFWRTWRSTYFRSVAEFRSIAVRVIAATAATAVVGGGAHQAHRKDRICRRSAARRDRGPVQSSRIHRAGARGRGRVDFDRRLARAKQRAARRRARRARSPDPDLRQAGLIGAVQGLCLPFRGFSRSGATISVGLAARAHENAGAETFSFALAVVLTPPVVAREGWRLVRAERLAGAATWARSLC